MMIKLILNKDPYGSNVTMDTNPTYGATTAIKMDTKTAHTTSY